MIGARHRPALARGHRHPPFQQIIDAGAPAHGHLAAGVFSNVAADGAGPGAGRVGRKNQTALCRVVHRAFRHHAGFDIERGGGRGAAILERDRVLDHAANMEHALGVDNHAVSAQGHRAAGQPRARAARNRLQAELADGRQQRRNVLFTLRRDHGQRQMQAPVGGVGGVRNQREGIELHILRADDGAERVTHPVAQVGHALNVMPQLIHQRSTAGQHCKHACILMRARGDRLHILARLRKEQLAALGRIKQFLEEIGIAAMDQHVAKDSHHASGRAAGHARAAQLIDHAYGFRTKQKRNRLYIVGGGVIERNLTHAALPQGLASVGVLLSMIGEAKGRMAQFGTDHRQQFLIGIGLRQGRGRRRSQSKKLRHEPPRWELGRSRKKKATQAGGYYFALTHVREAEVNGGEGEIRTPDSLATMSDFESGAFNRALPPLRFVYSALRHKQILPHPQCAKKCARFSPNKFIFNLSVFC